MLCLAVEPGAHLDQVAIHALLQFLRVPAAGMPIHEDHREAFSNLGLMQQHASSSDPQWTQSEQTPRKRNLRNMNSTVSTDGLSDIALSDGGSPTAIVHTNGHVSSAGLPLAGIVNVRILMIYRRPGLIG